MTDQKPDPRGEVPFCLGCGDHISGKPPLSIDKTVEEKPVKGTVIMCLHCGYPMIMTGAGSEVRELTVGEMLLVASRPGFQTAMAVFGRLQAEKN